MSAASILPALIERFFTQRLMQQRNASPHTIASYRDTFRLLLSFAQTRLGKPPSRLDLADLDAPFIGAFLDDLEASRSIGIKTRNLRLTAIRAFFRYAAREEPAYAGQIQRVLAIPGKLHDKREVHFLNRGEINAILAAPDRSSWIGRRDHMLLHLAVQTGLRVSEIVQLEQGAVVLGAGAHVRCLGKGRKERCTPLTTQTRHPDPPRAPGLAQRGGAARLDEAVSQRPWRRSEPRRRAGFARPACRDRGAAMSLAPAQARHAARPAAQRGDGAPSGGCR
jgi:integrase/recombinase XerD